VLPTGFLIAFPLLLLASLVLWRFGHAPGAAVSFAMAALALIALVVRDWYGALPLVAFWVFLAVRMATATPAERSAGKRWRYSSLFRDVDHPNIKN
jgi:hypothetical protein